jgi:hypothetical protein
LTALGDSAVIPDEPRTQGHWTLPSHASMLTGVYPGVHGYNQISEHGYINPDLDTIPEILANKSYRCSGLVTRRKIGPKHGFGRGFHRFETKDMSFSKRENDASEVLSRARQWVTTDMKQKKSNAFYFIHLFDCHSPYIPPEGYSDIQNMDINNGYESLPYGELSYLNGDKSVPDPDSLSCVKNQYTKSVEYRVDQLTQFVRFLNDIDILEKSLIIIVGDHGEDFHELDTLGHQSLYDTNIRPLMIVKPPSENNIVVPDDPDYVDILPTMARLVNHKVPTHCDGTAWDDAYTSDNCRINEGLMKEGYVLSVEMDDKKGLFTYNSQPRERPDETDIEDGPIKEEAYRLVEYSKGTRERKVDGLSDMNEFEEIRAYAEKFLQESVVNNPGYNNQSRNTVDVAVERRLQELGYK